MKDTKIRDFLNNNSNAKHIFCPYRICPLGAHVDHQLGLVTGFAIDKGVDFDFVKTDDGSVEVYSENFEGVASGNIYEEKERTYTWIDFIFGAIATLKKTYNLKNGIKGVIRGSLTGGGLSSSASVILTYISALAKVNQIKLTSPELINLALDEERNYIGVNVGKLDQSCEVYCKKNHLLYLDTKDDSSKLIPFASEMPEFEIAIIFSGMERKLAGSAYNIRVDECKAASYALKDFSHLEYGKFQESYLRDVPYGVYSQYKDKLPKHWRKRAEHYYSEIERVKKGIKLFKEGNLKEFGKLVFESGRSSIENYETGSDELKTLQNIMESTDGIYGGRFSGAGFNGCAMAIIDPLKKDDITKQLTFNYLKEYPELAENFAIYYCKTTDGINLI